MPEILQNVLEYLILFWILVSLTLCENLDKGQLIQCFLVGLKWNRIMKQVQNLRNEETLLINVAFDKSLPLSGLCCLLNTVKNPIKVCPFDCSINVIGLMGISEMLQGNNTPEIPNKQSSLAHNLISTKKYVKRKCSNVFSRILEKTSYHSYNQQFYKQEKTKKSFFKDSRKNISSIRWYTYPKILRDHGLDVFSRILEKTTVQQSHKIIDSSVYIYSSQQFYKQEKPRNLFSRILEKTSHQFHWESTV